MIKRLGKEWKSGSDIGALLLRLALGVSIFYGHGLDKWNQVLDGKAVEFADPLGIGPEFSFHLVLLSEGFLVFFVIVGLYTRIAMIPLIIAMFVAAFIFHGGELFNDYELPMLYFFGLVALFFIGPGKYSLDSHFKKR